METIRIKEIINIIINLIFENIETIKNKQNTINNQNRELLYFLIGSKADMLAVLTKLNELLMKISAIEKLNNDDKEEKFELNKKILL